MVLIGRTGALILLALTACRTPGVQEGSRLRDDEVGGSTLAEPPYAGPPVLTETESTNDWAQHCVGNQTDPASIPGPNYASAAVQSAAKVLSSMAENSFFLYGQINAHYKNSQVQRPSDVTKMAHEFLVYLCGEFRDRPSMIAAKIRWVNRTNYLATKPQPQIDPANEIWSQIVAQSYAPYLRLSNAYYEAKLAAQTSKHTFGTIAGVDKAVAGLTVCETKFMFGEYVDEGKPWDGLDAFTQKYETFKTASCTPDDLDYYYDFRGDSNMKPNSPESNGMIWHSISVALQCANTTKVRTTPKTFPGGIVQKLVLTDADCADYFRNPFMSRWNSARAGLGAWMLHDNSFSDTFSNSSDTVTVTPAWGTPTARRPHSFTTLSGNGDYVPGWQGQWATANIGLDGLLATENPTTDLKEQLYVRLRDAVDRHTDWYASGYDDKMNQKRERTQAYSPFVASSYEMSKSDMFTAPGFTVQSSDPNAQAYKHYMYIFKIHKDKWFTTTSLDEGKKMDFDFMWFDETSFGTTQLAKDERAWDRLGTPLESELDSILYLHNICSDGRVQTAASPCYP